VIQVENKNQNSVYKWMALIVVIVGTFMAILDSSIVNIAIPKMMAVYGVSLSSIDWVLTAYMLTLGAVIPLTGYLGDTFGTKKVYMFALALFTIGSLFCGLAWNISSMIISRVIQGIGGGMIMPVGMSIIYEIFPLEERGLALGFWGIASMAAPAIGPTLSGYIIQYMDWRLIFTLNIPIGIIGVIFAGLILKTGSVEKGKKLDYFGIVTSIVGLVSLLYVLGEGSNIDWSEIKYPLFIIIGIFSLILFVVNELTIEEPLLDLRILKIFPFTLSILISSLVTMGLYGGTLLVPLFLQNIKGFSAMQTGMLMFPSAIATGIMMPISGKLFDKIGARPLVISGVTILSAVTYELSKITIDTSSNTIKWLLVLRGIGLGLAMMPSSTEGMNQVPKHLVGRASALSNTIRQVSGSLSVTIITTLLQNRQNLNYYRLVEQISSVNQFSVSLLKSLQGALMQSGMSQGGAQVAAQSVLIGQMKLRAFQYGVNDTMLVTVLAAIIVIPMGMLIKGKKKVSPKIAKGETN
jgi:EmrB/QacA subfamily drug resistance transporter